MTTTYGEIGYNDSSSLVSDERSLQVRVTVGDLIRLHRRNLEIRLAQEELAYRSGISFEHLNYVENYKAKVSIEVLDRVALAFVLSLDEAFPRRF